MTFHLWLGRPGQETLQRGLTRDLAEEEANQSADQVKSPPCPACGKPVSDTDYRKHAYEDHHANEMCQPAGTPDAREAHFIHVTPGKLEEKVAVWRSRHPGVGLRLSGEGFDKDRKLHWQRFRVLDGKGRPAT